MRESRCKIIKKTEILLSQTAISTINRILTDGDLVQIDFNKRTNQINIYRMRRGKREYQVTVG